jgi:hypothetical protein
MNGTTRIVTTALIVVSLAASCLAQDPPKKAWVWLNSQGVWGYGFQLEDGPHKGLWRIDPDSKRAPEEAVPTTDPYGFAAILNQYRAVAGLHALAYDHDMSAWAAQNNAAQSERGLGHHISANFFQNCSWNTPDAASTADEWMNSRGHRANMLSSSVTHFGIAYGPGPYWTLNLR